METKQIKEIYSIYTKNRSICTDSRKVKSGDLYFALSGPNFNGNTFAKSAIEKGAVAAIVDQKEFADGAKTILVEDSLKCLQALSKYHRDQLAIPVFAITGSNGKTTTKELINAVLETSYKVSATKGNFNNHIGVPLTLLEIQPETEIAIVEMGANHVGEIASYCQWASPSHGLITNIGKAHLEGFGSIDGVIQAKTELYRSLINTGGTVFFNADDPLLSEKAKPIKNKVEYGNKAETGPHAEVLQTNSDNQLNLLIKLVQQSVELQTQLYGSYNIQNILAAVAVGNYFEIKLTTIIEAIAAYRPTNNRSQLTIKDGNHYYLDAYNANPASVRLALTDFHKNSAPRKAVVLGDMQELGEACIAEHKSIVELTEKLGFEQVFLVGTFYKEAAKGSLFKCLADIEQLKETLGRTPLTDFHILVKGSRKMQLERLLD